LSRRIPGVLTNGSFNHAIYDLRLGLENRLQCPRPLRWPCVPHDAHWSERRCRMVVSHSDPARCIWVIVPELEIGKRRKQRRGGIGPENDSSTIDGTSREGIQVKARHDTEVELPSFERREEIRVRCSVGIDNLPACEYDLEVDDAVTCPSTLWAEERYTS